jgi:hypothetical protein
LRKDCDAARRFHGLVIMIPHKIVDDEHAFLCVTPRPDTPHL